MEEWRKVPGWEEYEISIATKEGKCRRVFKHTTKEKANTKTNGGYIVWKLTVTKKGKALTQQAARWIAFTYPELVENEYFEGAEIDHKDTDRLNNHPLNLRWTDSSGQKNNPLTKQHMSECQIGMNINNPQISKAVIRYSMTGEYVDEFPSSQEAERQTGIHHSGISNCCNGKRKSAGGFIWKHKG